VQHKIALKNCIFPFGTVLYWHHVQHETKTFFLTTTGNLQASPDLFCSVLRFPYTGQMSSLQPLTTSELQTADHEKKNNYKSSSVALQHTDDQEIFRAKALMA